MTINGSNDDVGASEIVVDYYRGSLVICKGVLYVNYNNIWLKKQQQFGKVFIDMIGRIRYNVLSC